jgi:hypothetical protein
MHIGQARDYPTPVVSKGVSSPITIRANYGHLKQEEVLQDITHTFDKPRWHGTNVVVNIILKDALNGNCSAYFPPEESIEELVDISLNICQRHQPHLEDFTEDEAQTPKTVSSGLKLSLNAFARSAFFEGVVPIGRIHTTTQPPCISMAPSHRVYGEPISSIRCWHLTLPLLSKGRERFWIGM